ncbi:hypothetical protein V5O48_000555 [Marasmius crinis-equi]|uniref:N-acetyltransferase domain-containing protein n=1 Tax=Marasmius crinis-equi TaxID=585013 RepID=A0ABR3G149_9AGAR
MSRAKYSLLEIEKPTGEILADDQLGAITSLYRKAFGTEAETTFATLAGGREEEKKEAFIRAVVSAGKVVAAVKNDSEEIIGCAVWYSPKATVETERRCTKKGMHILAYLESLGDDEFTTSIAVRWRGDLLACFQ